MIMMLRRLPRRAATLVVAVMAAAALAVALAHSSQAPAQYGVATDGVIHGYGVQGSGAVHLAPSHTPSPDDNGVINAD